MQSLESIPTWFSNFFDITLGAAQISLSIMLIMAVLLPVLYLSRGRSNLPTIFIFFLLESLLVGIGWLPFWLMIATVALLAAAVASLGTKAVIGG